MGDKTGLALRLNVKVVLLVVGIAVLLLLVDMFFILDRSRDALTTTVGNHLQTIAELTASEVSRFLHSKVAEVEVLAAEPEMRQAASAASRSRRQPSDSASAYLREYLKLNPAFKRILLTDARGAFVAGSQKPIDEQGDEEWWNQVIGDGRTGAIHVGDLRYDPARKVHALAIDAPVYDFGLEHVIGVLRVFVDAAEVNPIIHEVFTGSQGAAMLVKADGTIISSRNATLVMKQKAEEMEAVSAFVHQQAGGYTTASMRGGARKLVAFADTRLAESFPELEWMVIVTQALEEAESPINTIYNRALATGFMGLLLLGAAGAYLSLHRPPQLTDLERTPE